MWLMESSISSRDSDKIGITAEILLISPYYSVELTMAKILFTVKVEAKKPRNRVAVAMRAQNLGRRVMKDRRLKRQNRHSWRKDVE